MTDTPDIRPVGDLPDAIGKTAARELSLNGIRTLRQVAAHSKKELLAIHGVGPKAVAILGKTLASKGLDYKTEPARAAKPRSSPPGQSRAAANLQRVFAMPVASVYPHYVTKAERKGRTKAEVDKIIRWLTGYTAAALKKHLDKKTTFEDFFAQAPAYHPHSNLITGVVCGIRVEDVEDPLMKKIRQLDKLIDEIARGKAMEKILR